MNQLLRKKNTELTAKKKKGFTLVELIIVIAIIAILAAMAIPKMGSVRDSANKKADLATAKNIATMIAAEISDPDGTIDTDDVTTPTAVPSDITNKLDGDSTAKANGDNKGDGFKYTLEDENITIFYDDGTTQVYPEEE